MWVLVDDMVDTAGDLDESSRFNVERGALKVFRGNLLPMHYSGMLLRKLKSPLLELIVT